MNSKIVILSIYLTVVAVAELVMTYHSIPLGLWIYATLLLYTILLSTLSIKRKTSLEEDLSEKNLLKSTLLGPGKHDLQVSVIPGFARHGEPEDPSIGKEYEFSNLLKFLTIAPLIRMLSTSMPVAPLEQIYWFMVINTPLFAIAFLLIRSQVLTKTFIGLKLGDWRVQLLIASTGILLGVIDYAFLKPPPMITSLTIGAVLIPSIVLLIFTGFSEELIFRGLIQTYTERLTGNLFGLFFASLLFAVMHIGWKSFPDLVFVFGVGLFFGYVFQKTRSLVGITLAHGITNITMFLVIPFIL